MWPDENKLSINTGGANFYVPTIDSDRYTFSARVDENKPSFSERLDRLEKRLSLQSIIVETQKDRLMELEEKLKQGD